jgi:hypothetical protein
MQKILTRVLTGFFLAGALLFSACDGSVDLSGNGGDTGGISLSGNIVFPAAEAGYGDITPRPVTVTNSGSARTVSLAKSGPAAGSFTLNTTSLNLAGDSSGSFTVVPVAGLEPETYNATITASADGVTSKSVNVSFTVNGVIPGGDPKFHVYIAFGQSNMQGPGAIEAEDRANVTDRFKILNVIADTYASESRAKSQWYTAAPPLIIPDSGLINWQQIPIGLSPVGNFGWTLTQSSRVPADVTIGVIAVANGDLGLASFSKDNAIVQGYYNSSASDTVKQGITRYQAYSTGGNGYDGLYQAIVQNARLALETGVIKGIIVHQGESGIANSGTISGFTWGTMFKAIYDDLLADLGLPPNSIPIIAGQTYGGQGPTSTGGAGNTGGALASEEALRTATGLPNVHLISSDGLPGRTNNSGQYDYTHFSAAGIRGLGLNYANKMIELVYP